MSKYIVSCSPHLRDNVSTRSIMQDVCIAMLPACIAGVLFFGYRAAIILVLAVAAAVLSEKQINRLTIYLDDYVRRNT